MTRILIASFRPPAVFLEVEELRKQIQEVSCSQLFMPIISSLFESACAGHCLLPCFMLMQYVQQLEESGKVQERLQKAGGGMLRCYVFVICLQTDTSACLRLLPRSRPPLPKGAAK